MSHHSHHSGCGCGDTPNPEDLIASYSLFKRIDVDNLECLNESVENSGRKVFRPWDQRMENDKFVESDVDEELLFNIPFTGNVKLKGIIIRGSEGTQHPAKMRLFKNQPKMTFDDVAKPADQEFSLVKDENGLVEYAPKIVTFSSVHNLTLHFPKNFGAETTKIYYIGLKGDWTEGHRHGVTLCTYEATPSMTDHKDKILGTSTHEIL